MLQHTKNKQSTKINYSFHTQDEQTDFEHQTMLPTQSHVSNCSNCNQLTSGNVFCSICNQKKDFMGNLLGRTTATQVTTFHHSYQL